MSSNVGLTTPRGSGTSGYVQRNLSALKPRPQSSSLNPYSKPPPQTLRPSTEILQHDALRQIEIEILSLRDDLEERNPPVPDEEIDAQCDALREKLTREMGSGREKKKAGKNVKMYQVHELAEAKIKESERLRRALGLRGDEIGGDAPGGDGGEHPMARQERRKREREEERAKEDVRRDEDEIVWRREQR